MGNYSDETGTHALTLHWDGNTWQRVSSVQVGTDGDYLYAVNAVATDDIWAVGISVNTDEHFWRSLTMHWDGSGWLVVPSPNYEELHTIPYGLAAVDSHDVWAVGEFLAESCSSWPMTLYTTGFNGARPMAATPLDDGHSHPPLKCLDTGKAMQPTQPNSPYPPGPRRNPIQP